MADTLAPPANGNVAIRLLRWLLGAFTLVGGLTWILLNLHSHSPVRDLVVGTVLAAGGLVLLMPHRIRLPGLATAITLPVVAVAGTAAGLAVRATWTCCMYAQVEARGWPLDWIQRAGVADDPATAVRLAGSAGWTADVVALATDVLFWAYAGLLLVVAVELVRRTKRGVS